MDRCLHMYFNLWIIPHLYTYIKYKAWSKWTLSLISSVTQWQSHYSFDLSHKLVLWYPQVTEPTEIPNVNLQSKQGTPKIWTDILQIINDTNKWIQREICKYHSNKWRNDIKTIKYLFHQIILENYTITNMVPINS